VTVGGERGNPGHHGMESGSGTSHTLHREDPRNTYSALETTHRHRSRIHWLACRQSVEDDGCITQKHHIASAIPHNRVTHAVSTHSLESFRRGGECETHLCWRMRDGAESRLERALPPLSVAWLAAARSSSSRSASSRSLAR
jgi:hypothetical protein